MVSLLVVWQLAHVTLLLWGLYAVEMCVYVVTGFHAVVRWQASHERVVMKCVAVLPDANVPV